MHGNAKEDGGRAPWEEAESIPESEEETWARISEQGGREMFLHSSDQPPWVCADSTAWGWNAIQPVPSSSARMPPPGSEPSPVLRGPGGQRAGDHGCLPGHLPPAPWAHQCPRLQPAAWGERPRQKAELQPGFEGEVPTICSVKTQIPVSLPSNRLYDKFSRNPSPNSQLSVSNWGSWVGRP